MNKLAKMIEQMEREDLLLLQKDLDAGNIERLIAKRLRELREDDQKVCPVCGTRILEGEGYTVEFGPKDLRQKATFDAIDCLKYFTQERLIRK